MTDALNRTGALADTAENMADRIRELRNDPRHDCEDDGVTDKMRLANEVWRELPKVEVLVPALAAACREMVERCRLLEQLVAALDRLSADQWTRTNVEVDLIRGRIAGLREELGLS